MARGTRESSCTSEMTGRMDLEWSTSVCVKCESLVSEVNNCNSSDAMLFIQIIKCEDASLAQPSGPVPLEFIETSSVCKFQVRNRTGTQTELGFILSTFQHPLSYLIIIIIIVVIISQRNEYKIINPSLNVYNFPWITCYLVFVLLNIYDSPERVFIATDVSGTRYGDRRVRYTLW